MLQLIAAVFLTVGLVVFSMANAHDVELSYVLGEPVRVSLIILLAITFVTGCVCTVLYQLTTRVLQRSRERERLVRLRLAAHTRDELEAE